MRIPRLLLVVVAVASLQGCAGIEVKSIGDNEADETVGGFRYYDTSPFLLISTDNKGGIKSEILYLPDTTKKRSIRPYSYGATNDTTLKFDNGKLVQAKAAVDETAIPVAVLAGLEKIAAARIKAASAPAPGGIPAPYLFRIVRKNGNWELAGGQALDVNAAPARIRYMPN